MAQQTEDGKEKEAVEDAFDLARFLPYQLNQAAEATSRGFQQVYRDRYGMTRTQWRVMANLGKYGAMTARDICAVSHIEKTNVSRAVSALEAAGLIGRIRAESDRRTEILSLTEAGQTAFVELGRQARDYDTELRRRLGPDLVAALEPLLIQLMSEATAFTEGDE